MCSQAVYESEKSPNVLHRRFCQNLNTTISGLFGTTLAKMTGVKVGWRGDGNSDGYVEQDLYSETVQVELNIIASF